MLRHQGLTSKVYNDAMFADTSCDALSLHARDPQQPAASSERPPHLSAGVMTQRGSFVRDDQHWALGLFHKTRT